MKALMAVIEALVKSRGMSTAKVAYKSNAKYAQFLVLREIA